MNKKPKMGLGQGLAGLLGDNSPGFTGFPGSSAPGAQTPGTPAPSEITASPEGAPNGLRTVSIDLLVPNEGQPRKNFDEGSLNDLARSIQDKGLLQPILVRPLENDPGIFEIVAGERRWRAAQQAQLHRVPIIVRDFDDEETLQIGIVENVQREDLTPIEEAEAYQRLVQEFGQKPDDIAKAVGKSRSHVANLMRLLALPQEVRALVDDGVLSMGHARALIGIEGAAMLAKRIVRDGLSVRQVEALVKTAKPGQSPRRRRAGSEKDPDTLALEQDIAAAIGLKVSIDDRGEKGGTISLAYRSLDQLDEVCRRLAQDAG